MNDEADLIERFLRPFPKTARGLLLGPGDDAALLAAPRAPLSWVITTDAVREGVHFGPLFRPDEIGHKALAVNLSDIAAMGALPRFFVCALELPPGLDARLLDGVARGMACLARAEACTLAGGNVTRGDRLAITITALGEVEAKRALRRDALRPGDIVTVTGALGAAAAGLTCLGAGTRRGAEAQLKPIPRVSSGRAALDLARAGIDVSDGLAKDVHRMAEASRVRVDLEPDDIPVARGASLDQALTGGEDYELVLGVPPKNVPALARRLQRLGVPLTTIGRARRGRGLFVGGAPEIGRGFDHLSGLAASC